MKNIKTKNHIQWELESRKVIDLIRDESNPRSLDQEQRKDIIKSINKFGRVDPLVINSGKRNNYLIGGNQRLSIYVELGIKEVDVMVPNIELSLSQERELHLRLNKNHGSWDYELLKEIDLDLLLDVGFGDEELQGFFDDVELAEDGYNVEEARENMEPTVKTGEIWKLGKHKLLVGDSTDSEQVEKLMNGEKVDLIYADSPYNIGLDYSKGVSNKKNYGGGHTKEKDSQSDEAFKEFLDKSISVARTISKKDAHFFYWCDASYIGALQNLYKNQGIDFRRICMWVKNNHNATPKIAFNRLVEPCVYGTVGKPYLNNDFRNAHEILNQDISTGNQLHDELTEMIDLWLVKRDSVNEYIHPTQKPVGLNEKPLKRCSAPGHKVFSGFGGSGSDLIACEQLNRVWFGVEKDPLFASIILDRWERFTGDKAELCQ